MRVADISGTSEGILDSKISEPEANGIKGGFIELNRDINKFKSRFQLRGDLENYNVVSPLHTRSLCDSYCV